MTTVSTHKIIGFDPARPPKIETFPCIYLFFELDEQAPEGWCEEFLRVVGKPQYPIKMDPEAGTFIETWVRKPEEIERSLGRLKEFVEDCNKAYDKKMNAPLVVTQDEGGPVILSPEQTHLNEVVAALEF